MSRAMVAVGGVLAALVFAAPPATAQVTTATFYGIVNDESGSALPGATVTMRHDGTGAVSTRATDASGEFVFAFVPITGARVIQLGARLNW